MPTRCDYEVIYSLTGTNSESTLSEHPVRARCDARRILPNCESHRRTDESSTGVDGVFTSASCSPAPCLQNSGQDLAEISISAQAHSFTPDLMPANHRHRDLDEDGGRRARAVQGRSSRRSFCRTVHRTPPKTQAHLLEASGYHVPRGPYPSAERRSSCRAQNPSISKAPPLLAQPIASCSSP